MARGNFICFDSLGSSEGVGFAGSISAPGSAADDREVHDRREHEGVHRRRPRGRARLRRGRHARRRRPHPGRLLQGRAQVGRRRSARSTASAGRCPATSRASKPTARSSLLGRGSVVINSGGEKVFPEEVEEAVKVHPDGRRLPRGRRARRPLRRSGHRGRRRCARATTRHRRRPRRGARVARALQAPAPVRVRARDRARPERQGRLQVGQGPGRRRSSRR